MLLYNPNLYALDILVCLSFMSLIQHEGYSGGLPGYPSTETSPDQGVPRQVRMLLLVTLQRAYVLARLSLDTWVELRPATDPKARAVNKHSQSHFPHSFY